MSDKTKPAYCAFVTTSCGKNNSKIQWRECGAMWEHKDGNGVSLDLDVIPVNGKVTIRRGQKGGSKPFLVFKELTLFNKL